LRNIAAECIVIKAGLWAPGWLTDTGTITSDSVAVSGAKSVLCCVDLGAIATAGTSSIQVTECVTVDGTFTDIAGATITADDGDDYKLMCLEIVHPRKNFIRIDIDRATADSSINAMFCIINQGQGMLPVTQPSSLASPPTIHQA